MQLSSVLGVLVAAFMAVSSAQAATKAKGLLESANEVRLWDNQGKEGFLENGPIDLVYQRPGAVGLIPLFTGHRQILLKQGNQTLTFDLHARDFYHFGNFKVAATEKTPITLSGQMQTDVLDVTEQDSKQSCTYAGYCYACSPGLSFQGKIETTCSFKLNLACRGSEPTRAEVTRYQESTTVSITDESKNAVLGVIHLTPVVKSSERTLRVTGSCR